ncbi:MAG: GNAT family N-acetyltransferase [Sulfuricurvum sp.]|nr:GNAT family N-acetyltransferase [Sulfuricurvum sp.]
MSDLLCELFSIEDDFVIDKEKQTLGLKLLLNEIHSTILVASVNNEIVGMITMQTLISTASGGYVGLIEDLIVTKNYRGIGIGSKLLKSLIDESQHQGLLRLALGADIRNTAAILFYRKHGFAASHMGLMYRF